jgi:hypothetical protein
MKIRVLHQIIMEWQVVDLLVLPLDLAMLLVKRSGLISESLWANQVTSIELRVMSPRGDTIPSFLI